MTDNRSPQGLSDQFAMACISIFIGVAALSMAAKLLAQVWVPLAIGLGVVALFVTAVLIFRWRRDHW